MDTYLSPTFAIPNPNRTTAKYILGGLVGGAFVVAMAYVFAFFIGALTELPDWRVFWEVSISNPFTRDGFLNPWWAAWILAPLHLITQDYMIGYGLWVLITFSVAIFVLRDDKFLLLAGILSPYFFHQVINGQIDAIVLVGYYLLTQTERLRFVALALMLVKPQSMIGSLVVWGLSNIRKKVLWQAVGIVAVLVTLGFVLYGNWIGALLDNVRNDLYQPVNASWVFDYPLIGVVLLVVGIWRKNIFLGGLATLFFTPYIAMHSLWVYWTAWLMERPNKYLVVVMFVLNWHIALRFTI